MENIAKAIRDKHAKELDSKNRLVSAQSAFDVFKAKKLEQRRKEHEDAKLEFANEKGEVAKREIVELAKKQLKLIEIKRLNEQAAEERRRKAEKIARDLPKTDAEENTGWARGGAMAEAKKTREEDEKRRNEFNNRVKPSEG